jgi:TonB family protein
MRTLRDNTRGHAAVRSHVPIHALQGVLVSLLLTASSAQAQDMPSPQTTPRTAPTTVRTNCDAFTPHDVKTDAATFVSVRITAEGEMRDPTLFRSSGNDDLDKAALACADGYHVGYVSVEGKPAEVTWVLAHSWAARGAGFGPAQPPGSRNEPCKSSYHPDRIPKPSTTVSYRIATDGTVKDATVVQSSGVPVFDSAAVNCVASWRFFPATQNGQPVEVGQALEVNWGGDGTGSNSTL